MIAYIEHELKNLCQGNAYTDLTYVDNYFTHISGYSVTITIIYLFYITNICTYIVYTSNLV